MRLGFVGFLLALALFYLVRSFMAASAVSAQMRHPWPWLGLLGAGSGAMGGLFGVGGARWWPRPF